MQLSDGNECMRVVMVLQAFAQRYLQPRGLFEEECECSFILSRIINLLVSGGKILGRLSLLLDLIQKHHKLYKKCYPHCCKPKLHLLYHLPETFRYLCGNSSCFTAERKHRWSKRLANNAAKRFYKTLLIRLMLMECKNFRQQGCFEPIHGGSEPSPLKKSSYARLRELGVQSPQDAMQSWTRIHTPRGVMSLNDIVRIGSDEFGIAISIFPSSKSSQAGRRQDSSARPKFCLA